MRYAAATATGFQERRIVSGHTPSSRSPWGASSIRFGVRTTARVPGAFRFDPYPTITPVSLMSVAENRYQPRLASMSRLISWRPTPSRYITARRGPLVGLPSPTTSPRVLIPHARFRSYPPPRFSRPIPSVYRTIRSTSPRRLLEYPAIWPRALIAVPKLSVSPGRAPNVSVTPSAHRTARNPPDPTRYPARRPASLMSYTYAVPVPEVMSVIPWESVYRDPWGPDVGLV